MTTRCLIFAASLLALVVGIPTAFKADDEMAAITSGHPIATPTATPMTTVTSAVTADGRVSLTVDFTGHFAPGVKVKRTWKSAFSDVLQESDSSPTTTKVTIDRTLQPVQLKLEAMIGGEKHWYEMFFRTVDVATTETLPTPTVRVQSRALAYTPGQDAVITFISPMDNWLTVNGAITKKAGGKWLPIENYNVYPGMVDPQMSMAIRYEGEMSLAGLKIKTATTPIAGAIQIS